MVRAKLLCKSKTFSHYDHDDAGEVVGKFFTIQLDPVNRCSHPNLDADDEDSIFGKFTPSGSVSLTMIESAASHFEPGELYYADFQRAS